MTSVVLACCLLVVATTVIHYEVLRGLNAGLPALRIPSRAKLLVVIFVAFLAHAVEMALYGGAFYALIHVLHVGEFAGITSVSLANAMYFSAETYTSLGFGDLAPGGPLRLLAGLEALNGLLLIGWSASFTYISMARFWSRGGTTAGIP